MSRSRKATIVVVASAGIVSTPLFWLLDKPDTGQLVGASIQGATGITALLWAWLKAPSDSGPTNAALDSGKADASGGGTAGTGVKRRGSDGGTARAERTGDATATGHGSTANTGVDLG